MNRYKEIKMLVLLEEYSSGLSSSELYKKISEKIDMSDEEFNAYKEEVRNKKDKHKINEII